MNWLDRWPYYFQGTEDLGKLMIGGDKKWPVAKANQQFTAHVTYPSGAVTGDFFDTQNGLL